MRTFSAAVNRAIRRRHVGLRAADRSQRLRGPACGKQERWSMRWTEPWNLRRGWIGGVSSDGGDFLPW